MNTILAAYATQTGSTKRIAEYIADILREKGEDVDVRPVDEAIDVSGYKGVVLGSAIQGQKVLPAAMSFIQSNKDELSQKPFAVFIVCMTLGMRNGNKYLDNIKVWLSPVRALVPPVSEGYFPGILDLSKITSFAARLKFRISIWMGVWKQGEHYDWQAVRLWAETLDIVKTSSNA